MKCLSLCLGLCLVTTSLFAQQQPVRMGSGAMTFETVPGWGLRPDGKSALGPTHGGVVVDKDRNVYVSADKGVVVFSPDGKVIRAYEGDKYARMHDIEIRDEDGTEYIYGARNANAEGLKFNARTGEIVMHLPLPAEESGLGKVKFSPTAITVAPNGDIFLSNGYATNHCRSSLATSPKYANSLRVGERRWRRL